MPPRREDDYARRYYLVRRVVCWPQRAFCCFTVLCTLYQHLHTFTPRWLEVHRVLPASWLVLAAEWVTCTRWPLGG